MKLQKIQTSYDKDYFQKYFIKKYKLNHLEDNYFNYIDYENIFSFSSREYSEIQKLVKKIDKIFLKAYDFYFEDFENNLIDFKEYKAYFRSYVENYFIWRYDVLIDEKGDYKFIELNANTPWLITDIYHVQNKIKVDWYINISKKFQTYVKKTFKEFSGKKIWILLPYSYEDEDYLVCMDYYDLIKKVVPEENIVVWDIYEANTIYDEKLTLKWEVVDVLLSFFPVEFFLSDTQFLESFLKIVKTWNLEVLNPIETLVLQDKLIMAIIWENLEKYTKKEQVLIKKHIPFTTRKFQSNEEKFIAKNRFGRVGRDIFDKNFWNKIEEKTEYIYQEKIKSKIFDKKDNFMVLWFYTNFKKNLWIIARKQKAFITKDGNNKVVLCYKEK